MLREMVWLNGGLFDLLSGTSTPKCLLFVGRGKIECMHSLFNVQKYIW